MISPKERQITVLDGGKSDRVPAICPGGMMNMITKELLDKINIKMPQAHHSAEDMAELAKAVYRLRLFENYGLPFCMTVEAEDLGAEIDMGSDIYEPNVIKYPIESVEHYKILNPISTDRGRVGAIIRAIKILKDLDDNVPIIGNITGPISTASSVVEPVDFYKELIRKKEASHEFLEFVTKGLIDYARAMVEAGADIIAISDPSGTGEILGPKLFKEYVVKYLNMLLDGIKDEANKQNRKVRTIVHICGRMDPVFKEVDEVKANALSFDSMVSMKKARENLPNRVLMGNVSTFTLEFGKAEDVRRVTKSCLENGTNIISPACGLGIKSPLSNISEILKTIEELSNEA